MFARALHGCNLIQRALKVASSVKEAIPLIEAGFVEASDFDGVKIFKIPKSRVGPDR